MKQSVIHAEDCGGGGGGGGGRLACALKNFDFPTVLHGSSDVLNIFLLFQITNKPVIGENFHFGKTNSGTKTRDVTLYHHFG